MSEHEKLHLSAEQRTALEASIRHWEGIMAGTEAYSGKQGCECCKQFWSQGCNDCPVCLKTGQPYCSGTPCESFAAVCVDSRPCSIVTCACDRETFVRLAKAELDFLISCREPS